MRKLFRAKMLPLLLTMALIASTIDPGFIRPSVVFAAEESTAPQQGTQAASSIVLGKGTIEIDGHLFTDEEFQTFLSNAKIYRVPFEQSSTFALGDYGEIVGEDAQATGGLVILSNALIGVFQKLSVIFDLAELAGSEYIVVGLIGLAAVRLAIQFLPDAIQINGVHINKFNSTLVGLTNFFTKHQNANPDEEIVDPDTIGTGGTTKPGAGTGDTAQPGEGSGDTTQPGEGTGDTDQPGEEAKPIPHKDLSELPQNVQDAFDKYDKAGWKGSVSGQTDGTRAGREYKNKDGQLPLKDSDGNGISYREWDVNNKQTGDGRDKERFVTGSDDSVYYTDSHYGQAPSPTGLPPFVRIR